MHRYRVEIWVAAQDALGPYATIRTVTLSGPLSLAMFCAGIEWLQQQAKDPRQLPRIADVVWLH